MRFGSTDVSAVVHSGRPALDLGAIESVSEVAKARQNELTWVELAIDGGREDGDVGPDGLHGSNALRCGDDDEQANVASARALQQLQRGQRAASGRQHRVDKENSGHRSDRR